MKIIQSEGGPLVGIERKHAPNWSGVEAKSFIGNVSQSLNDYHALESVVIKSPPVVIGKLIGLRSDALVIAMPCRTALIDSGKHHAFLAQVDYANEGWSFDKISRSSFEIANFDESLLISVEAGGFLFFDAALSFQEVDLELLDVDIEAGVYKFSVALYKPDPMTMLYLYKIVVEL